MFLFFNFIVDVNFFEFVLCVVLLFLLFLRLLVFVGSLEFMVMKNNVLNWLYIILVLLIKEKKRESKIWKGLRGFDCDDCL